jgi:hypothetical protein
MNNLEFCARRPSAPVGPASSLRTNQRGAVMVLAVVAAVFLLAAIYYLFGLGQALFLRERTQDAADSLALSGAVALAQGMNVVVFLNLLMAALVTVLLALKVVEALITAALVIAFAAGVFMPAAALAVPTLETARRAVQETHRAAKAVVDPMLRALHATEDTARRLLPGLGIARAGVLVSDAFSDIDAVGLPIPSRLTLPVESDDYNELCKRAKDNLHSLVDTALEPAGVVGDLVGGAVGGLTSATARFYCGSEGKPPVQHVDFNRELPQDETARRCERSRLELQPDSNACEQVSQQRNERRPMDNGQCASGNMECLRTRDEARRACTPRRGVRADSYTWTGATVVETFVFDRGRWQTVSFEYTDTELQGPRDDFATADARSTLPSAPLPCGRRARSDGYSAYAATPQPVRALNVEQPVCSERAVALNRLPPSAIEGTSESISYAAVQHIYRCAEKASADIKLDSNFTDSGGNGGQDGKKNVSPMRMLEDIELGAEDLMVRSLVTVDAPGEFSERMQRPALWGKSGEATDLVKALSVFGQLGVAQAEYFFDHTGTTPREDWLWQMKWRARFRRFGLPKADKSPQSRTTSLANAVPSAKVNPTQVLAQAMPQGQLQSLDLCAH